MNKLILMTGNKLLLDTNIVIELFKGYMQILAVLERQENVYIPAAVLGELAATGGTSINTTNFKLDEPTI